MRRAGPSTRISWIWIATLLSLSARLWSQPTSVRVLDQTTSDPCLYANVVLTGLDGRYITAGATDKNGVITFGLDKKALICISFVGFQTYTDTIAPGEDRTIRLERDFIDMEAVVVTGQHVPKPVDKSIYKIDVLDARTLQERGVNNLAEALSNETNIRLAVDPSTGTSIEIQGMGGENIKYLIDGIPIIGRVDGNIDLTQLNMENIDHIEIVQGPMSVQYGTSAIAGVINIITRKNSYFNNIVKGNSYIDNKGNYNFGLYGSVIRGRHTVTLSGNRNMFQGVDIDLNVDTADADGHDRYMEFKPKRVYNADAEYAYRKNNFQLSIKSQYMNMLLKNYLNYVEKVILAYDADYHTTRSLNSVMVSDRLSESFSYNIIGAYTYFGRSTDYITSDLYLLTREVTKTTSTVFNNIMTRGSFMYAPQGKKFSLTAGWDLNYDNGNGDKIKDGAEMGDYALFVSSQYDLFRRLSLQPGLRVIYNTIYGAPVVPSMNIRWNIMDNIGFRISYARGFRAPSLKELYLDFHDSNHDLTGNKELKAETTNSFNASVDYTQPFRRSGLKIEPGLFYNNGKDAITLIVTNAESNSATNVNLGGRRTLGGEINTSFRHISGFMIGAGFSRVGETFDSEGSGDYLPIIFYNNYSLNTKYSFNRFRAVIMANLKYYGETPSLAAIPEENGGGYYRVFTAPFGDLEVTFSKSLWKQRLDIVVGGKNLLNNHEGTTSGYRDYGQEGYQSTYDRPLNYGRTYFVKLNLRFIR
jgi:outer membrane receptor for ferrienterochelin and colicins